MDVKQSEFNEIPVLINLGLFVIMACYMASAVGFVLAR